MEDITRNLGVIKEGRERGREEESKGRKQGEREERREPEATLLKLLAQHRQAVALPGKPLELTNRVTHHITLQPDAQPSYVPSYRLPHSQRQVVQQKVDELLQDGVIQESHSPWNSPLFLVGKKDGSYRPVLSLSVQTLPL